MKKYSLWLFIFILFVTILAVIINLSEPIPLNIDTKIPFTNKKISIHKKFNGITPNISLGSMHFQPNFKFRKGLDLEGGTTITLKANMNGIPQAQRENALKSAQNVIERRINFFGVSEPVVQTSKVNNDYRILVEIPGVTDVNQAVSLIGKTAKLTFWEEGASGSAKVATPSGMPLGLQQILGQNPKQTNLTGGDLQQAAVSFETNSGKPQVNLTFTSDGAKKFAAITKRNVGKIVAIALDNQLIELPTVKQIIPDGNAVINGSFTTEQAKSLMIQLNAGALPISLSILEQHAIGATLGESSLQKSLTAGALGFLVIVIFMIILYGRLGVIASMALIVYTLIILSLFRIIPVTLTLAGIAGFILSIGIAVDANILIFERMKEELKKGRSQELAIDLGFSRAWPSIRDSNVSSIITSLILIYFGTGIVRGFAVTLLLGVLVSMFSAIIVTRTFLQVFYRRSFRRKK
jgi:preprotein translocase subunit SecD